MVVTHNLIAQNAGRMLGITGTGIAKSSEKLASGYMINRAADDAAGLAISEKMRAQIRGLNRASLNAQDGISVLQTAEGAFNEVHAMLQRLNELCTQAANDTNTATDRSQIQKEVDQLVWEIDDTTKRTQFNTMPILGGINKYKADGTVDPTAEGVKGLSTYHAAEKNLNGVFQFSTMDSDTGELEVRMSLSAPLDGTMFWFPFGDQKAENTSADYVLVQGYRHPDGTTEDIRAVLDSFENGNYPGAGYYTPEELINNYTTELHNWNPAASVPFVAGIQGLEEMVRRDYGDEIKSVILTDEPSGKFLRATTWADQNEPFTMKLQIGALEGQGMEISIDHLNARGLGIAGLFVDSYEDAGKAMDKVQKAIDKVSSVRANLGAQQNRLEHTIANLDNTAENIAASESRLRDTDMAKEMTRFTKLSILQQAGQSILAQANTSSQGVLSLLR